MKSMTFEKVYNNVCSYISDPKELEMIKNAYICAEKNHSGQKRQSGEAYITHPLAVAFILSEIHADAETIAAGILHDTIEDTCKECPITKEYISEHFNLNVASLVAAVSMINKINFNTKEEENESNAIQLLSGITEDVRSIIIKLADRLHNMRTLEYKPQHKQIMTSTTTMDLYIPIANYLGVYNIKNELEDLCLKYLEPDMHAQLSRKVNLLKSERLSEIKVMMSRIKRALSERDLLSDVTIREKNLYESYKQVQRGHTLRDIPDLFALRILANNTDDCYRTLGIVHSLYQPVDDRFKDYIVRPKVNMYQSIHTTLFGPRGDLVQAQIRTPEMNLVATHGITAYLGDGKSDVNEVLKAKFNFFKSLVEINQSTGSEIEFLKHAKSEILASNTIRCFTPKGSIVELPIGAIAVDFAYKLHTEIGETMTAAIINGSYAEPSTELHDKDRVKIITGLKSEGPNLNWLPHCKTALAKKMIPEYYHRKDRQEELNR